MSVLNLSHVDVRNVVDHLAEPRLLAKIHTGSYSDCSALELAYALRRFDLSDSVRHEVGGFLAYVVLEDAGLADLAVRS